MFPSAVLARLVRKYFMHEPHPLLSRREVFLVGWTGMRGVVALAAAISIPTTLADGTPFAQRDLILFLTFSTIFVTVVLQGLTLAPLVRSLKLDGHEVGCDEEIIARRAVLEEVIRHLESEEVRARTVSDRHGYEDLLDRYRDRLEALATPDGDPAQTDPEIFLKRQQMYLRTIRRERAILLRLRDQGVIRDDVQRRLERELDLSESRFAT
jgi:CPA1 family monovalent cation:H+ antiporter